MLDLRKIRERNRNILKHNFSMMINNNSSINEKIYSKTIEKE